MSLECDLRTARFIWNGKLSEKERIGILTDAFRDIRKPNQEDEISNTVIQFGALVDFDEMLETFEETPNVKNRVCNSIARFFE